MDPSEKQCARQSPWSDDSLLQDFGELGEESYPLGQYPDFSHSTEPLYNSDRDSFDCLGELTEPPPPKRTRTRRARLNAKTLTIRCKPRRKPESPHKLDRTESLESLVEDMFAFPEPLSPHGTRTPSEVDSTASTARTTREGRSDADSPQPYEHVFQTLCEGSEGLQTIVTCLQNGNVDVCSIDEKKKLVSGLKERLQELEGGVEALKESLKKLIKYTI